MSANPASPQFTPTADEVKLWHKQAFDYTSDATKQLITIAAGVVTATAIFLKDLNGTWPRIVTVAAWIALLVSAICGTMVLTALAGNSRRAALGLVATPTLEDEIIDQQLRQFYLFFFGIFLIIVSGTLAAFTHPVSNDNAKTINVVSESSPAEPYGHWYAEQTQQLCPPTITPAAIPQKRTARKPKGCFCNCVGHTLSSCGTSSSAPTSPH
jgi:hypothetical protein